jgi:Fe-S cluster assembly ATP-binding protein
MLQGEIVESGGPEMALQLEEKGYDWLRERYRKSEEA